MASPMTFRARGGRERSAATRSAVLSSDAHTGDERVRVALAEGRDGVLRFLLRRVPGGLYVEREEQPRRGTRTSVSVEFADRAEFGRWCDNDPCRFQHPLLHQRVQRHADELWQSDS